MCDRRLSRAARTILDTALRPLVNDNDSTRSDDIWTLLEHWLRHARPAECPLFPSRDQLRYEEEQSIPLSPGSSSSSKWKDALPVLTIKERRHTKPNHSMRWWKCGICSKVFMTRYYLDQHMQNHHAFEPTAQDELLVCPANTWCQMLGVANCHHQALKDEPFYDRGSGGWNNEDKLILHKYAKLAHSIPCSVPEIQTNCRTILETCRIVDTSLCDALTCPAHHHPYYYNFWKDAIPDDWQSFWMYETKHSTGSIRMSTTIVGILFCLGLCIWFYFMIIMGPFTKIKENPGKGLLPKSAPRMSTGTMMISPPRPPMMRTTNKHRISQLAKPPRTFPPPPPPPPPRPIIPKME